jgi:hypothetical protein
MHEKKAHTRGAGRQPFDPAPQDIKQQLACIAFIVQRHRGAALHNTAQVIGELMQDRHDQPGLRGVGTCDQGAARFEHVAQAPRPAVRHGWFAAEPQLEPFHHSGGRPRQRFQRVRAVGQIQVVDTRYGAALERACAEPREHQGRFFIKAGKLHAAVEAARHQRKKSRGSSGNLLDSRVRRIR